jgi:hypothetical protein
VEINLRPADDARVTQGQSDQETIDSPGEPEGLVCPACGYDLRAITNEKCPECGFDIDRASMSVSRIPWEHRREIGRLRAYLRTTWLVMFHPRRFAGEMNRPVDYRSARRFQLVSVVLAWLPILAGMVIPALDFLRTLFHPHRTALLGWRLEQLVSISVPISVLLFLFMATGISGYWFHPRSLSTLRQNRAIALSYYTCAPLGWTWLPGVLFLVAFLIDISVVPQGLVWKLGGIKTALQIVAFVLTLAIPFLSASDSLFLMSAITRCGAGRKIAMGISLPAIWIGSFCLAGAVPAGLFWISMIVLSFR